MRRLTKIIKNNKQKIIDKINTYKMIYSNIKASNLKNQKKVDMEV